MLQKKIAEALNLLQRGEHAALEFDPLHGYLLMFSGGKDSQAVYHLLRLAGVNFEAVYVVVGIDSPDNVQFIREHYPDVRFLHPKEKFFQLVRRKGLPTIAHPWCCAVTKETVGAGRVVLTGVRRDESRRRSSYGAIEIFSRRAQHRGRKRGRDIEWLEQVEHTCISGQDKIMLRPIIDWTESEVWEFLSWVGAAPNPLYRDHGRVGCMFCPYAQREVIEGYERKWPKFREALLKALQAHIDNSPSTEVYDAEEFYDCWKDHESIERCMARHAIAGQP